MKRIRYFWKYILSFVFSFFLLSFLIFGVMFFSGKQFTSYLQLDENVIDRALYTRSFRDSYGLKEQDGVAYYRYETREVGGESVAVLEMNSAALKYGLPCENEYGFFMIALERKDLPSGILMTNKAELSQDGVQYTEYMKPVKMENYFVKIDFDVEYLFIDDDLSYEEHLYAIYPDYQSASGKVYDDYVSDSEITISGANLKKMHRDGTSMMMKIFAFITIVPLLFGALALSNLYLYYLEKQTNIFEVQNIYYRSRKRIVLDCTGELLVFSFLPSLAAILILYFALSIKDIGVLLIAVFLTFLIEILTIFICVQKKVKKRK